MFRVPGLKPTTQRSKWTAIVSALRNVTSSSHTHTGDTQGPPDGGPTGSWPGFRVGKGSLQVI